MCWIAARRVVALVKHTEVILSSISQNRKSVTKIPSSYVGKNCFCFDLRCFITFCRVKNPISCLVHAGYPNPARPYMNIGLPNCLRLINLLPKTIFYWPSISLAGTTAKRSCSVFNSVWLNQKQAVTSWAFCTRHAAKFIAYFNFAWNALGRLGMLFHHIVFSGSRTLLGFGSHELNMMRGMS